MWGVFRNKGQIDVAPCVSLKSGYAVIAVDHEIGGACPCNPRLGDSHGTPLYIHNDPEADEAPVCQQAN